MKFKYHVDNPKEIILERMSQEDIFSLAFGQIDFNQKVTNPLRYDRNPGAWFEYIKDTLYFRDFAWGERPLDAFEFLSIYYDIPIEQVYEYLLNLDEIPHTEAKVKKKRSKRKSQTKDIVVFPIEMNGEDEKLWNKWGLTVNDLKWNNVVKVSDYYIGDRKYIAPPFTYAKLEKDCIKIYKPLAKKGEKFISSCTGNEFGCLYNVDYSNPKLIITKSFKDCILLRKIGYNAIYVQGEGIIPTEMDILKQFKEVYILFDNDTPGKVGARNLQLMIKHNTGIITKVIFLKSAKDASDVVAQFGIYQLKKELYEQTNS